MLKLYLLFLCLITGCSQGQYRTDFETTKHSSMVFVGVPTALGIGAVGSTVPVSKTLSLTNKHVAHWMIVDIVSEHPSCDLALIKQDNKNFNDLSYRNSNIGDSVYNYGYSGLTALPVSSKGKVLTSAVYESKDNSKECVVGVMSNGVVAGMSGGPVIDTQGNLVGVNVAYGQIKDFKTGKLIKAQFFIPYVNFKEWLNENVK